MKLVKPRSSRFLCPCTHWAISQNNAFELLQGPCTIPERILRDLPGSRSDQAENNDSLEQASDKVMKGFAYCVNVKIFEVFRFGSQLGTERDLTFENHIGGIHIVHAGSQCEQ